MIPLMKNTFSNPRKTSKDLSEFILNTDRLSMGEYCALFEKKFSEYQGSKFSILFNSGASSNLAILQAARNIGILKPGDDVGFSGLTWSTNVMPIIQMGFTPVPIDCDPKTLNVMSKNLLERLEQKDVNVIDYL